MHHWKYPGRDPSSTNDIFLNGPTHLEEVCVPECGGEAEDVVPLGMLRDGLRGERGNFMLSSVTTEFGYIWTL